MFQIPDDKHYGIFCTKTKKFYSYSECKRLLKNKIARDKKKKLVILLSDNSIFSILNYIFLMVSNHVVLILDDKIKNYLLTEYLKKFQPSYVIALKKIKNKYLDNYKFKKDKIFLYYENKYKKNLNTNSKLLIPTSGSHGNPKVAMLSRNALKINAKSIIQKLNIKKSDTPLLYMPIYYSYGMSVLNTHLFVKSNIVVTNYNIMQKKFWDLFNKYKVTSFSGVPYTYETIFKLRLFKFFRKNVKVLTQAGGHLSLNLKKFFHKFATNNNIKFYTMYGQTEAGPRMTILKHEDFNKSPLSVGRNIGTNKITVIDKNKKKILNQKGTIINQSKSNMLGYALSYNDLKNLKLCKTLDTGDIGIIDKKGFLKVVGRSGDEVKILGKRVNVIDIKNSFKTNLEIVVKNNTLNFFFDKKIRLKNVIKILENKFNLKKNNYRIININKFKLLKNNKIDISYLKRKYICS